MGGLNFPGIDQAIANFEGFGTPNTQATINNNPGNIICGSFATSNGALACNGNFALFANPQAGADAEDTLVSMYASQGATIESLINSWAPPTAPGNSATATNNYVNSVAAALGVSPSTPVSTLVGQGVGGSMNANPTSLPNTSGYPLSGVLGSILNPLTNPASPFGAGGTMLSAVGLSYGRIGAFLLGLIMIIGGIYLFKPVQQVVSTGTRAAGRVAEFAAL